MIPVGEDVCCINYQEERVLREWNFRFTETSHTTALALIQKKSMLPVNLVQNLVSNAAYGNY